MENNNKMKKVLALLAMATLMSCASKPKGVETTNWLGKKVTLVSQNPEEGTHTAERKNHTSLSLQATNSLHPVTMYDPEKMVIVYEYTKKSSAESHADDFYREEIYFEIPAEAFKKTYKDAALQDVKLIFGKHCYCKGEAGYYRITEGMLKVDHKEDNTCVSLTFKAPVNSELHTIEFTVE